MAQTIDIDRPRITLYNVVDGVRDEMDGCESVRGLDAVVSSFQMRVEELEKELKLAKRSVQFYVGVVKQRKNLV